MREPTVARSYAAALFELARREGHEEAWARALRGVATLVASDRRIRDFLSSPKIEIAAKKRVLREALDGRVAPLFLNFLLVVLDKRRQRLLGDIAAQYDLRLDEHVGRIHVAVTLAHEPDEREAADITSRLGTLLGKTVVASINKDEQILGGIVVRYGDRVLNGSLRRRLMMMRARMLDAPVPGSAS
ncbi:MAG: ATP synthase F1 subunit delta [Gemmatimonadetes bacterium]|nr:ATP synthase F1 subunit delta [Gemmatimonadota bacterium]